MSKTLIHNFGLVALFGAALGLSACATNSSTVTAPPADMWTQAAASPEAQISAAVLAGEYAARQQWHADAAEQYAMAARLSDDPKIAARATQLALLSENAQLAHETVTRWIVLAPDDAGPYEIAARLALRAERWDEAVDLLRASLRLSEAGDAVVSVAEILAAEPGASAQALGLLDQICADLPLTAQREYARGLLAYKVDDLDVAKTAIAQAMMLEPDWRQAQLLALRLHLQAGEGEQAEALMRELHVASPKDLELRLALGSLLLEFERLDEASKEFSRALKIAPDNVAALYALALIEMDANQHTSARRRFLRLLELGVRTSDAAYYLGRIAEQEGQLQDAMRYYGSVNEGRRVLDASIRQVVIVTAQGGLESALGFLATLRERYPDEELRLYQVEGELLFQAHEEARAEDTYKRALEAYPDDVDLLYGRSIVRERLGNFVQAEEDLRRLLSVAPDDARALNALGYMLSNHTDRLDEAATYVQRALDITPDDPAVTDSMGWLYYRQGNLVLARNFLERAYANLKDAEIAAHLGEVMWMQGEQELAREVWRESLLKHPTHPALNETIRRLDTAI